MHTLTHAHTLRVSHTPSHMHTPTLTRTHTGSEMHTHTCSLSHSHHTTTPRLWKSDPLPATLMSTRGPPLSRKPHASPLQPPFPGQRLGVWAPRLPPSRPRAQFAASHPHPLRSVQLPAHGSLDLDPALLPPAQVLPPLAASPPLPLPSPRSSALGRFEVGAAAPTPSVWGRPPRCHPVPVVLASFPHG